MPLDNSRERRRFGRRPVFKVATLVQATGERVTARVIDLSDGGARLRMAPFDVISDEFQLEIPEDDFTVKCRIIHRHDSWIGVEFTRSPRRMSWIRRVTFK